MTLELELQYAEFHPDQVQKVGQVDLQQTLRIIHSFPWDREFEKIEERTKKDLTSTVPNVSIRNKNKELLIVSARDRDHFIIEFLTPTHRGEQIIPVNSFENRLGITTEDIVRRHFDGTITKVFKLKPVTPIGRNDTDVYKLREYPLFVCGLTIGVLAFILIVGFWSNGLSSKALPAVYFVGLVILSIGFSAIVTLQYLLNDWGKEVSFDRDGMTIKQNGRKTRIVKNEIDQIAVIENDNHRTLRHYKYARIKTKNGKTFIVTSFIMDPMDLVNKLIVNHKEESVFLPTINLDSRSERKKERIKREGERMRIEFLENFKDYQDSKLKEIIADKKSYADYAVEAAVEILERRKTIAALNAHVQCRGSV